MASWFRSWHGAPTDPKWRVVARIAEAELSQVVATAWALLDCASQCPTRGSIDGADPEVIGESVGVPADVVERILLAMHQKNILRDNNFAAWSERQPKREDDSADRVTQHRERKRNAVKRTVTQCNAPDTDTESEADTEEEKSKRVPSHYCSPQAASETLTKPKRVAKSPDAELLTAFDEFWKIYPRKVGKTQARKEWLREIRPETVPDVIQAALRYCELREGEPEKFTRHASTWLHDGAWRDSLTDEKPKQGNGNGTGYKGRAERDAENRRGFLEQFGIIEPEAGGGGTDQRGSRLLGPGAPDA